MNSGLVFNIQRYSLQDGPGIRTTVFLKGCPLACAWCHNPESQLANPEVVVIESRCVHCGECRQACPQPAGPCVRCGACVEACPTGARQMVGQSMTVQQVLAEVRKDRVFYDDSGGGVTFSGGEPLLQPDFLKQLLIACRAEGYSAALDTSGYAPRERFLEVSALADLVLYDLKVMDEARHIQYTGVSNTRILENLQALGQVHRNIWIRVPVIPGLNDAEEEMEALARFAAGVPGVVKVCLLPYHKTAGPKFTRLGRAYSLDSIEPPSPQRLEQLADRFRTHCLEVRTGG